MAIRAIRNADLYFTVPFAELTALREYHELIEANLSSLIEGRGFPSWDGDPATSGAAVTAQLHQWIVDGMLPTVLRGPLLLSLWAIYESTLVEMAEFLRGPLQVPHGLLDAPSNTPRTVKQPRRKDFITRARFYYEAELGLRLFPTQSVEQSIRSLYLLRNALAHAGGRKWGSKKGDWEALSRWAARKRGIDVTRGVVAVEADFVREQIQLTHGATDHIVKQVRDKLEVLGLAK